MRSEYRPGEGFVPVGYGSFYMPALDAHGGWIGSASDMVRFSLAAEAGNAKEAFGLGWNSVAVDGGFEWSHAGALEGSNCGWMTRRPDGTTLAFVINTLPVDYDGFFGKVIPELQALMASTTTCPDIDLFG
jgi:CubicO group peptidase (beta-lactamase class C family)